MSIRIQIFAITAMVLLLFGAMSGSADEDRLRIATTSSLYDTKLLDLLEGIFEERNGIDVDIVSGGTGIAIEYGERGDVDLIMIHDKPRELKFIQDEHGMERRCLAYNYFWMVGPKEDPAGIKGMNASQALKTIMEKGTADPDKVKFVSRGDNSGTHAREKLLWKNVGVNYSELINSSAPWYKEAGKVMSATLVMTDEMQAYTLSDMSTFTAYRGNLSLVPLIEGSEDLLNVYVAIPVNPATHPGVNCKMALEWVNFLVSDEVQGIIATYGEDQFGVPLFFPASGNCQKMGCPETECAVPCSAACS